MPWIKVFSLAEAKGFLKKEYEAALKRAGRIWHIVSIIWSLWHPLVWKNHRNAPGLFPQILPIRS